MSVLCIVVVTKMNTNPTNPCCKIPEAVIIYVLKTPGHVSSSTLVDGDLVGDS